MNWTPQVRELDYLEKEELFTSIASASSDSIAPDSRQDFLIELAKEVANHIRQHCPVLFNDLKHMQMSRAGVLVIENLPIVVEPRILIGLLGWLAGDVVRFKDEGDFVIEIKETVHEPGDRPSFRNSREFFLHSDLSYFDLPPDLFILHSIHNDPKEGGYSTFCHINTVLQCLTESTIEELQKPQYLFPAPSHYKGASVVQFPILSRSCGEQSWFVRFRRDNLRVLTYPGVTALIEFIIACQRCVVELSLKPNSAAIIDNRRVLHGRTAFVHSKDTKTPRHINRLYVNVNEMGGANCANSD